MTLEDGIRQAAQLLAGKQRVAALTGAGVSKESGVPTFREAQTGLWARFDPAELATPDAFRADPDRVWAWYQYRWNLVSAAKPNPGHLALVELEELIPHLAILTQNVDGLHQRAGSSRVIELHGRLGQYRCADNCRGKPTLIDLNANEADPQRAPNCPHCGAKARPDVVWFGETLPPAALEAAHDAAMGCEAMLVIGTSGVVQPAASLPLEAKRRGAPVIDINPMEDELASVADLFLQGPSGEILPKLAKELKKQAERS